MSEPHGEDEKEEPSTDIQPISETSLPRVARQDFQEGQARENENDANGDQPPPTPPTPIVINIPPPEKNGLSVTDWITAVSTFIIMIWAGLQWLEMHGAGGQTEQLIKAANINACAARQIAAAADKNAIAAAGFATSAEEINTGIGEAAKKLGEQAKATRAANKIAEDAVKLQVSNYNPILEISDVRGNNLFPDPLDRTPNQPTKFFVFKDHISFQFYVTNKGIGEAKNIHFAMSKAHDVRNGIAANTMADEIRMAVDRSGMNLTEASKIPDLEGGTKTQHPVVFTAAPGVDPHELLMRDVAEWFYGEMYWDNEIAVTHGWKRRFCFVIRPTTGDGETIASCGIPQEGVSPR